MKSKVIIILSSCLLALIFFVYCGKSENIGIKNLEDFEAEVVEVPRDYYLPKGYCFVLFIHEFVKNEYVGSNYVITDRPEFDPKILIINNRQQGESSLRGVAIVYGGLVLGGDNLSISYKEKKDPQEVSLMFNENGKSVKYYTVVLRKLSIGEIKKEYPMLSGFVKVPRNYFYLGEGFETSGRIKLNPNFN